MFLPQSASQLLPVIERLNLHTHCKPTLIRNYFISHFTKEKLVCGDKFSGFKCRLSENIIPETFKDWFAVRYIRDNEAFEPRDNFLHANKCWFTVLYTSN